MSEDILKGLLSRFFRDELTQEEKEDLARWVNHEDNDEQLNRLLESTWQEFMPEETIPAVAAQELFERISEKTVRVQLDEPRVIRASFNWYRIAAAASIILVLVAGIWFMQSSPQTEEQIAATNQPADVQAPETNRAMITLADGSLVYLDELADGEVAQQGNIKVIKLASGQIAYQSTDGTVTTKIAYNTLTNPRGSKVIDMKLSDGSRVWLNAGSSITYPVVFSSNDRKVELTGEGYFEIAHNPSQPFFVSARGMEVKVLGTHFNVNAYEDEDDVRTTLLQGAVALDANGTSKTLKPGQQAVLRSSDSNLRILNNIDVEEAVAWKNGYFSFQDAGLKDVMKQISRWYDVDVRYEGTIEPRRFRGGISRSSDIDDVLKILERSRVRFKVEGRTIIVTP